MQGKIALEEHFAIPETLMDSAGFVPESYGPSSRAAARHPGQAACRDGRAGHRDDDPLAQCAGGPGDTRGAEGQRIAARANDYLAEQVAKRPERFQAFAALPMQDPDLAIAELDRASTRSVSGARSSMAFRRLAMREPPLLRSLAIGRSGGGRTARRAVLSAPAQSAGRRPRIYEGHEWLLGPTWAFGQETAVHALRLMGSGLFDHYPGLRIILGHMGEGLPYSMWRIDHRNAWVKCSRATRPGRRSATTSTRISI